jgi:cyclopropane fatty-acyl-phospholipid synthase-like methyltransferase
MKDVTLRDRALAHASVWEGFKTVIRADRMMKVFVDEYMRPEPGERILDVGCGTGDVVKFLNGVDYLGVDLSDEYIERAEARVRPGVRFEVLSADELVPERLGVFDVVTAIGVMHHLPDETVGEMLTSVAQLLTPGGRFIAIDPVWDPTSRTTARVLAALDRGRFVRAASGYAAMVGQHLESVHNEVRHDLLPIPYTYCVTVAERPAA